MKRIKPFTPLLVCGTRRSGTSLILRLLDGEPKCFCLPRDFPLIKEVFEEERKKQFFFSSWASEKNKKQNVYFNKNYQKTSAEFLKINLGINYPCFGVKNFKALFKKNLKMFKKGELFSEVCSALALAFIQGNKKIKKIYKIFPQYVAYKAPLVCERFAEKLALANKKAIFIHIMRDPISRAMSALEMDRKLNNRNTKTPDLLLNEWTESIQLAISNEARIGTNKYFIITYEDLILSPELVLKPIFKKIGIKFQKNHLQPTFLGIPVSENSSFGTNCYSINKNKNYNLKTTLFTSYFSYFQFIKKLFDAGPEIKFYLKNVKTAKKRKTLVLLSKIYNVIKIFV